MKIKKDFENYLLEQTIDLNKIKTETEKILSQCESSNLLLIKDMVDSIIVEQKKLNRKALDVLDDLIKLEKLLNGVGYE